MTTNTQELVRQSTAWQEIQVTPARQAVVAALLDHFRTTIGDARTSVAFDDSPSDFVRVLETFDVRPAASAA